MNEFQERRIAKERKKFEEAIRWSHPDTSLATFNGVYMNRNIRDEWLEWCRQYGIVRFFDIDDDSIPF